MDNFLRTLTENKKEGILFAAVFLLLCALTSNPGLRWDSAYLAVSSILLFVAFLTVIATEKQSDKYEMRVVLTFMVLVAAMLSFGTICALFLVATALPGTGSGPLTSQLLEMADALRASRGAFLASCACTVLAFAIKVESYLLAKKSEAAIADGRQGSPAIWNSVKAAWLDICSAVKAAWHSRRPSKAA